MTMVRNFSIKWNREVFTLKIFCLAPSGKKHVTTIHLSPSSMEHMAHSMLKAVEDRKNKVKRDGEVDYIG